MEAKASSKDDHIDNDFVICNLPPLGVCMSHFHTRIQNNPPLSPLIVLIITKYYAPVFLILTKKKQNSKFIVNPMGLKTR